MRRTSVLLTAAAVLGAAASFSVPLAAPAAAAPAAAGCQAYVVPAINNAAGTCSGIDPRQSWAVMASCDYWDYNHVRRSRPTASALMLGDGTAYAPCGLTEDIVSPFIYYGELVPNGPVGPISGYAGKCVDVKNGTSADRTPVQIFACNGTAAQQWKIAEDGTIRALNKCLDVAAAGTTNGTKVQLYTCNRTGAQQWRVRADGSILNPASGRCLDNLGFSTTDGNQLGIWDCNGLENQIWHVPA
ncbi:ricin-type beta-trefoil lectin domain protein [Kitasatospora sp. NPDC089913]|uniref:ricin-type beta-trefoil lectin domain protein n=1 Tax=Streptomycetaceae TaxID=2062 RepID=UPI00087B8440|nr:ricin-type beta-trefoil lectin domain protein [Streptomyces sp. TLI_053]SDT78624.1 Ricin-type beta-trefoil lectin domain-containing protein [Streptomyces sp. TLI_053]